MKHMFARKTAAVLAVAWITACAGVPLFASTAEVSSPLTISYSADAFFNAGNTASRADDYGHAILDYERALALSPGDPGVSANLESTFRKAGIAAPEPAFAEPLFHALSLNGWAWAGSAAFVLLGTGWLATGSWRPWRNAAMPIILVSAAVLLLSTGALCLRWPELNRALVLPSHASLRIAPASASAVSCEMKGGEVVNAGRVHGGYIFIRGSGGRSGWASLGDIEPIIPKRQAL